LPPHIALIAESEFPPVNRANLRIYYLGRALRRRGGKVIIFGPSVRPYLTKSGIHDSLEFVQFPGFSKLLYRRFLRLVVRAAHIIAFVLSIINYNRSNRISVIHAWNPIAGLATVIAGRLIGSRVFLDFTDFYSDIAKYESPFLSPIFSQIERFILHRSDIIFTVSSYMKKEICKLGVDPIKVKVIPDGVDVNLFTQKEGIPTDLMRQRYRLGDGPVVMFHGDIKEIDGLDILISAFAIVMEEIPNAKLLIVGGGDSYYGKIKNQVSGMGIQESVVFTGWVSHDKIPALIDVADVGVLPLRSTRETHCYLSFKLFEYWAMSKPVIVSDVRAISELVRRANAGFIFKIGDVRELATTLKTVLTSPDMCRQAGKNGRSIVKSSFNWDGLMNKETSFYSEVSLRH